MSTDVGCCAGCGVIGPLVIVVTVNDWIHQCCPACARRLCDPLGAR